MAKKWNAVDKKTAVEVREKATAVKTGTAKKEKTYTLTRVGLIPHGLLRKMAVLEGVQMQEMLDRLLLEYKAKKHPGL